MIRRQPTGGRFTTQNTTLHALLSYAYGVQGHQITGGPAWIGTDLWDITARPEGDVPEGLEGDARLRQMMQNLLVERFGVVLHNETKELPVYGMRLVLPAGLVPDKSGWKRLVTMPVVLLEGDGGFRKFLAECEKSQGLRLQIGAECTTYSQAVDLAVAAGWAVFVPELGWRRRGEWVKRHQKLPGLNGYRHTLQLGWNERIIQRRPDLAKLVDMLRGTK
jgi:hypothetical protein